MTDAAVSTPVACEFCGEPVPVRHLREHEEDCRKREHPTTERME